MSSKPLPDDDNLVFLAGEPTPEPTEDEEELDLRTGRRDDQLALRLTQKAPDGLGNRVRYDHKISVWYIWDGVRWKRDDKRRIHVLLRHCVNRWFKEASGEAEVKELSVLLDMRKQQTVLESLSTMPPITMVGTEFDTDPNLLGCKNGTVDLTTGILRDGQPADLITLSTGVDYEPTATCPMFEHFLQQVTANNPAMVEYLKLIFGAALFGHIQPQEFYVFWGSGGNGKGVLLNLIAYIFGDYAIAPPRTMYVKTRHGEASSNAPRADLINLYGKRLSHVSEPDGQLNEAALKEHTGNDPIRARDLNAKARNTIEFLPTFSLFFRTNNPPEIEDTGSSMQRRARVIPFRQEFSGPNRDDTIDDRLKSEAKGVLALLVRYAMKYHADPASIRNLPHDVQDASDDQVKNRDPLTDFIAEACVIDSANTELATVMYAAYIRWVVAKKDPDHIAISLTKFGTRMGSRYPKVEGARNSTYRGIGLLPTPEEPDDNND